MRYFDEQLVANSRPHRQWWSEVGAQRETFHVHEATLADLAASTGLVTNAAAVFLSEQTTKLPNAERKDNEHQ
jgi:hypothetical protein